MQHRSHESSGDLVRDHSRTTDAAASSIVLLPTLPGPWTRTPNECNCAIRSNGAAQGSADAKTMRLENLACAATVAQPFLVRHPEVQGPARC